MRMGYKLLGSGKNFPGIFRTWQKGLTFVYFLMWQHACCRLQVQLWFGLIQSFHLVLPLGNKARMSRISYAAWVTHWGFYALGRLLLGILQKEKRGWLSCACLSFNSFCTFFLSWFCLEYTSFFFSGNFLLQRAKKPLSFHLCFFHNDIEWSGEENVKPSRFCEYTQFTIRKWSKSWVLCFQPNSSNALKRYMFMSGGDDATPTSDNITTLNSACGAELVKFCCKIVGWQDQHWTVTDSWCWWVGNIAAIAEKDGPVVLVQY